MTLFDALLNAWRAWHRPADDHDLRAEAEPAGWGRFPECLPDGRAGHTHLNHL